MRLAHSMASALDFTSISQKPPTTSLASGNGPSFTTGLPPGNDTRTPVAGGCKPSIANTPPAFSSSALYLSISPTVSASGIASAGAVSYPFGITIIMKRIVELPCLHLLRDDDHPAQAE